jgi:hypothetical protein
LQKVNCNYIIKQKNKKHHEGRDEGEAHGVGTFFNCLVQQLAPRHKRERKHNQNKGEEAPHHPKQRTK